MPATRATSQRYSSFSTLAPTPTIPAGYESPHDMAASRRHYAVAALVRHAIDTHRFRTMERARLLLDATRALCEPAQEEDRKLAGAQASLLAAYRTVLERRVARNAALPVVEGAARQGRVVTEEEQEQEQERLRVSVAFVVELGDKCLPVELLKEVAKFLA